MEHIKIFIVCFLKAVNDVMLHYVQHISCTWQLKSECGLLHYYTMWADM